MTSTAYAVALTSAERRFVERAVRAYADDDSAQLATAVLSMLEHALKLGEINSMEPTTQEGEDDVN